MLRGTKRSKSSLVRGCARRNRWFSPARILREGQPTGYRTSDHELGARGNGQSRKCQQLDSEAEERDAAYALQVFQHVQFRAQPSMYTQELLVHDGSKR